MLDNLFWTMVIVVIVCSIFAVMLTVFGNPNIDSDYAIFIERCLQIFNNEDQCYLLAHDYFN